MACVFVDASPRPYGFADMSIALHRLAEEVFDQPLLYHAGKAATFVRTFGPRLTGQQISIVRDVEEVDHTAFANRPLAGILGTGLAGHSINEASYPSMSSTVSP